MRLGLIPLDERPANTRYPAMIAAIGGASLALPPTAILSARRRPADCAALAEWLAHAAPALDGLVVSCEMLGYGGLIASRTSHEPAGVILARLDALRAIRRGHPRLPIVGFSLIARVSNADDAAEEPQYWATFGARLYRLSQLLDRRRQGQPVGDELDALAAEIPQEHRQDFLRRRLRNHAVNLGALQLLADGALDLLALSSDDTSPYGLPSREKRWLAEWAHLLGLSAERRPMNDETIDVQRSAFSAQRLLMYPGADEVGCALVARLLNQAHGVTPSFAAAYAPPEAADNVAAYEDGPIRVTVERQVRAVGGRVVEGDADVWVAVDAPLARRAEWTPEHAGQERAERLPALASLAAEIELRLARGQPVVVADVAYPNGADPALVELLLARVDLTELAAYGGWNTAGNTIGTALAQACAARLIRTAEQRAAQQRFLLHRIVEDWGYQQIVRAELREWLRAEHGLAEPTPELLPEACALIERRLDALIERLPGFAGRWRLASGSACLPWGRTFEVDFELDATA